MLDENGTPVPNGSDTAAFAIVGNVYYGQDATTQNWYTDLSNKPILDQLSRPCPHRNAYPDAPSTTHAYSPPDAHTYPAPNTDACANTYPYR